MDSSNKPFSRKIIITEDGSHSILVPDLDETYHSSHGAVQEAEHIFIKDALAYAGERKLELNVLEIGFGTGLNALLTFQYAESHNMQIRYYGIEKYPVLESEYTNLNYSNLIGATKSSFLDLHKAKWRSDVQLSTFFTLHKSQVDFRKMKLPNDFFDVVYFDAFAPDVQADLWTEEVFGLIYQSMKRGGVMTTYSVKGKVRRAMKAVGFNVEKIPGPAGKREISRAVK